MKAHEISLRILKGRNPAHADSNLSLGHTNSTARLLHFLERGIDGAHRYVVHKGLARHFPLHQPTVNPFFTFLLGFDEKVIHFPRVANLPAKSFPIKLLRALKIVCWDFKMND